MCRGALLRFRLSLNMVAIGTSVPAGGPHTSMLFNTALFAVFFAVFFLLYQFSMSARRPRLLLIFVFSLIFYAQIGG
jgi:hypothetical protein